MRKLLVFLLILVVLAVAGDMWLRGFAEDRASDAIGSAVPVSGRTEVEIDGFPFLLAALTGDFDAVTIRGARLETEKGVTLRHVNVRLEDAGVSVLRAAAGRPTRLDFRRGTGSARLAKSDLAELAGVSLSVLPDVAPELSGGSTLSLGDGDWSTIALPLPLEGMAYTDAQMRGEFITLRFELPRGSYPVG